MMMTTTVMMMIIKISTAFSHPELKALYTRIAQKNVKQYPQKRALKFMSLCLSNDLSAMTCDKFKVSDSTRSTDRHNSFCRPTAV